MCVSRTLTDLQCARCEEASTERTAPSLLTRPVVHLEPDFPIVSPLLIRSCVIFRRHGYCVRGSRAARSMVGSGRVSLEVCKFDPAKKIAHVGGTPCRVERGLLF